MRTDTQFFLGGRKSKDVPKRVIEVVLILTRELAIERKPENIVQRIQEIACAHARSS